MHIINKIGILLIFMFLNSCFSKNISKQDFVVELIRNSDTYENIIKESHFYNSEKTKIANTNFSKDSVIYYLAKMKKEGYHDGGMYSSKRYFNGKNEEEITLSVLSKDKSFSIKFKFQIVGGDICLLSINKEKVFPRIMKKFVKESPIDVKKFISDYYKSSLDFESYFISTEYYSDEKIPYFAPNYSLKKLENDLKVIKGNFIVINAGKSFLKDNNKKILLRSYTLASSSLKHGILLTFSQVNEKWILDRIYKVSEENKKLFQMQNR